MCVTVPVGSGPGDAVRKRIASGCENRGSATLVRHVLAERETQRDLDEVDTDGVPDEIRHLAARDAGGDLDDGDAAVRRGDQLREGDPVAQSQGSDGALGGSLGELELIGVDRGRVEMDPADAEADPRAVAGGRRASRVGRRRRARSTMPFISVPSTKPSRIASRAGDSTSATWRFDSRSPGESIRKTPRCPPESTGFRTAGSADRLDRGTSLREAPHRGERRLRDALLGERAAHGELVRHSVGDTRCRSTAGRVARRRPRRPARRGRQRRSGRRRPRAARATRSTASTSAKSTTSAASASGEPRRVGVPVDGDDPQPPLARLDDRPALMSAGADEEDARHGAMLDG